MLAFYVWNVLNLTIYVNTGGRVKGPWYKATYTVGWTRQSHPYATDASREDPKGHRRCPETTQPWKISETGRLYKSGRPSDSGKSASFENKPFDSN